MVVTNSDCLQIILVRPGGPNREQNNSNIHGNLVHSAGFEILEVKSSTTKIFTPREMKVYKWLIKIQI